jgi:thioredoxin reductase (NADPH)
VPGVFIAGVIASGFHANRIFIENGRDHGTQIAAALERQAAAAQQRPTGASAAS